MGAKFYTKELVIERAKKLTKRLGRAATKTDLRAVGLSDTTVYRYIGSIEKLNQVCGYTAAPRFDLESVRNERAAKAADSIVKAENKLLHKRIDSLEAELVEVRNLHEPAEPEAVIIPKQKGAKPEIICGSNASDWHPANVILPSTINGMNEFNLDIAEESIHNYFRNILKLVEIERSQAVVRTFVLWLGGDLIHNTIHPEMAESNPLRAPEETRWVQKRIIEGINFLLQHGDFDQLIIPCSFGNHGRSTDKKRIATAGANSYERMMYQNLEDWFEDEPRVKFHVAGGEHLYLPLMCPGGKTFTMAFAHGDTIKGGDGIVGPLMPVARRTLKLEQQRHADLRHFAHFHWLVYCKNILMNGCLCGFDAYAESIGAPVSDPSQAFWSFHPGRFALTDVRPVWVRRKQEQGAKK